MSLEKVLRELAEVLAEEETPSPETALAAIDLAVEALEVATRAFSERPDGASVVEVPLPADLVLASTARTSLVVRLLARLVPVLETRLVDVDEDLLHAQVGGRERARRLKWQGSAALTALSGVMADSRVLAARLGELGTIEIRKDEP